MPTASDCSTLLAHERAPRLTRKYINGCDACQIVTPASIQTLSPALLLAGSLCWSARQLHMLVVRNASALLILFILVPC